MHDNEELGGRAYQLFPIVIITRTSCRAADARARSRP